jgi:Protein of unknown function (DUF4238)
MANNKNQHFVPRCYLRAFTRDGVGKAISVFNLDRKKLVPEAPVKSQCSRDYFYGKDAQLENAIQLVESGYAKALRSLVDDPTSLTAAQQTVFRIFWLFQHLRTEAAAMSVVRMNELTREAVDFPPGEFSLGIKEAVQLACKTFADSMHEIDDLKFCVFKNRTEFPFVTSDNPAVLTNRWQLDTGRNRGLSFGMHSAGMLALLPLTPKLLLLGYDGDVYNVPHENGIVTIKNVRDVIAFNRHQFLQCVANVYVHDCTREAALHTHYLEVKALRPLQRHLLNYAQIDKTIGNVTRYVVVAPHQRDKTKDALLHSQVIHPNPGMWPSQLRLRPNGSVYTNGTGAGYIRLAATRMRSLSAPAFKRERS